MFKMMKRKWSENEGYLNEISRVNNRKNRIPEAISEVLKIYFERLEENLPNVLESFYLFGSVSLDAYQDGMNDIDFEVKSCHY